MILWSGRDSSIDVGTTWELAKLVMCRLPAQTA
jgi:hypothetical protein